MFSKLNNWAKRKLCKVSMWMHSYTITEEENRESTKRLFEHCKTFTSQYEKTHSVK